MGAKQRVGFIGLGNMGSAMAGRLLDAGYEVTVWSRTSSSADELVDRGAIRAAGPEEAIATGTVCSMLSNEDAVRQVFTAERLAAAPAEFVHVNHATISPEAATEFHASHDGRYLAAPVLGRPPAVVAGKLVILASGDPALAAGLTPILEAMGRRVWEFGPEPQAANAVKLSVNYLIIHALQALGESVTLLEKSGLDAGRFVEMINDSLFPGAVYGGYGQAIATSSYTPPGFTARLGLKDVNLVLGLAEQLGVRLPTGAVLRDVFETAVDQVGSELDWASVAEVTRRQLPPGTPNAG
ncbi:NAD(P)-dependent oxidoreductase [Pseudonocardiaceae bacterium YIM PH 21723]|nr:NAD(P)-dependent oxidoreductase [Pseudonocardiaceae bacterium YIM PH 21723]